MIGNQNVDMNYVRRLWRWIGGFKGIGFFLAVGLVTLGLCVPLLSGWKISHADSIIHVVPDSEIAGDFHVEFQPVLNGSTAMIRTNLAEVTYSDSESKVDFHTTYLAQGQILTINLVRIQITEANLSLIFPFRLIDSNQVALGNLLDCRPYCRFNGTIYLFNQIIASTPLGSVPVYRRSFATSWVNGNDAYVGEPDHFHDTYRIPHLIAWSIFLGVLLIGGLVGSGLGVPFCGKRYPFFTLLSLVVVLTLYVASGTGFDVLYRNYKDPLSLASVYLFSPFFHEDYVHLMNNFFVFILISLVLESGFTWSSAKYKTFFYWFPIFASGIPFNLIVLAQAGTPGYGLSLAIGWMSAECCFLISKNRRTLALEEHAVRYFVHASLIGFVLLTSTYSWVAAYVIYPYSMDVIGKATRHILAFLVGVAALGVLSDKTNLLHNALEEWSVKTE